METAASEECQFLFLYNIYVIYCEEWTTQYQSLDNIIGGSQLNATLSLDYNERHSHYEMIVNYLSIPFLSNRGVKDSLG